MNDSYELTPKEKFFVSLFKQPDTLFRRSLIRKIGILALSLGLMIAWFFVHDPVYVFFGYGLLVFLILGGTFRSRSGIQVISSIILKYEAQIEAAKR